MCVLYVDPLQMRKGGSLWNTSTTSAQTVGVNEQLMSMIPSEMVHGGLCTRSRKDYLHS